MCLRIEFAFLSSDCPSVLRWPVAAACPFFHAWLQNELSTSFLCAGAEVACLFSGCPGILVQGWWRRIMLSDCVLKNSWKHWTLDRWAYLPGPICTKASLCTMSFKSRAKKVGAPSVLKYKRPKEKSEPFALRAPTQSLRVWYSAC